MPDLRERRIWSGSAALCRSHDVGPRTWRDAESNAVDALTRKSPPIFLRMLVERPPSLVEPGHGVAGVETNTVVHGTSPPESGGA